MNRVMKIIAVVVAYVAARKWIIGLPWSDYGVPVDKADDLLFAAFLLTIIALNFMWIRGWLRPGKVVADEVDSKQCNLSGSEIVVGRTRTLRRSALAALLGLLATPFLAILAGPAVGSNWLARIGVPMFVVAVSTGFVLLVNPERGRLHHYLLVVGFLLGVAALVAQTVVGLLLHGSSRSMATSVGQVSLRYLLVPAVVAVARAAWSWSKAPGR